MIDFLGGGGVRVSVHTLVSGVEPGGSIYFVLKLIQTNISTQTVTTVAEMRRDGDYDGGRAEASFDFDQLGAGIVYSFMAQAGNRFGRSHGTNSTFILITELSRGIDAHMLLR